LKDSVLLVSLVLFFSLKEKKQTLTVTNRVWLLKERVSDSKMNCELQKKRVVEVMGRPPSNGGPSFRFMQYEVCYLFCHCQYFFFCFISWCGLYLKLEIQSGLVLSLDLCAWFFWVSISALIFYVFLQYMMLCCSVLLSNTISV
jgi:hypothetical protein